MGLFVKLFSKLLSNTADDGVLSFGFKESPIASLIVTEKGEILQVNNSFLKMMGYKEEELLHENMSIFKSFKHDNAFYKNLWKNLDLHKEYSFEIFNRDKNGAIIHLKGRVQFVKSSKKEYFIVSFEDITQQRLHEQRQQHLATHDPLTGLANRALLTDRYEHAILNAKRHHTKLGIMICDLNEFKQINDSYGHNFGDAVLKEVSKRLESLIRASDTVARYGGDEFILILEQIGSVNVEEMKKEIHNHLTFDINYENESCRINTAIGHACFPSDGTTFEQLVSVADNNMYDAKREYYGY